MKVIPSNNTNPESNICLFSCNNQKTKKKKFKIKKKGRISDNTLKKGKALGAKKGNKYARKVNTVSTVLKKNIILLNQDCFGIIFLL